MRRAVLLVVLGLAVIGWLLNMQWTHPANVPPSGRCVEGTRLPVSPVTMDAQCDATGHWVLVPTEGW